MTTNGHYVSQHQQRVDRVADTIKAHTKLGKKASEELAVHVLQVIDYVPEKMR